MVDFLEFPAVSLIEQKFYDRYYISDAHNKQVHYLFIQPAVWAGFFLPACADPIVQNQVEFFTAR